MPARPTPDRRPLMERVRPATVAEMIGASRPREEILAWARRWEAERGPPRYRAALLTGPPGVGKTSLAHALARTMGWTLVEMNASEARNQGAVEEVAGRASLSHTLGESGEYRSEGPGGRTLILIDEADCMSGRAAAEAAPKAAARSLREFLAGRYGRPEALSEAWGLGRPGRPKAIDRWSMIGDSPGRSAWAKLPEAQRDLAEWRSDGRPKDRSDRGGYGAIGRLVKESQQPVVLTANEDYELSRKVPALRSSALWIRLAPLNEGEVVRYLQRVADRERIHATGERIAAIAHRSQGDLRAALNDLDALSALPTDLSSDPFLEPRRSGAEVEEVTRSVLSEPRFYRAGEIRDRFDGTPEDIWPWMEENAPRFSGSAAATVRALDRLVEGELLVARARRQRIYGLWPFATEMLTGGVASAIGRSVAAPPGRAAFPEFLGRMGQSRAGRADRDAVLLKIGRAAHLSKRKTSIELLPLARQVLSGPPARGRTDDRRSREWARTVKLTAEEIEFLGGALPDPEPEEEAPGTDVPAVEGPEVAPEPEPSPARAPARESRPKVQRSLKEF